MSAIENLKAAADPNTDENTGLMQRLGMHLMQRNNNTLYKDNDVDKEIIFQHLYKKIEDVKNTPDQIYRTGKNLIYYSIFLSDEYLQMLEWSLNSISYTTKTMNFDVLFITDEKFKQELLKKPILQKFNCYFHIVDTPVNGIEASFNKLCIYDYNRINEYEKVLFLDTDIMCIKDLNEIFNYDLTPEKLNIKSNLGISSILSYTSATHGLMYLTHKDAKFIDDNTSVVPFNAGQFLFLNSHRMKLHFENVRWLKNVWAGIYFFEQSFMNHYFVFNDLTDEIFLYKLVSIIFSANAAKPTKPTPDTKKLVVTGATNSKYSYVPPPTQLSKVNNKYLDYSKKHTDDTVLLHFAGYTLNGPQKLDYISTYAMTHGLAIF